MYAKNGMRRWLPVAAVGVLVGWTGLLLAQEKKPEPLKPKDIVDVAKDSADMQTFCKLIESAALVETLKDKGPFTVLIPTDEAFKKLGKELDELSKPENKAKLERVLKHHVLEGSKTAAEIKAMKTAKTLAGEEIKITVKDDVLMVDAAKVTKTDMVASNGLIHVVDTVLMPPEKIEKEPKPVEPVE